MVDNQHKKISGYRDLTEEEIGLMNEIKEKSEEVGKLCSKLQSFTPVSPNTEGVDGRWVSIGITDLQKGFMSLVRAVARPTTF